MDTCIVLRTAVVKDGMMYVQAGAGIVAELRARARAGRMRQQGARPVQAPRRRRCASPPAPSAASEAAVAMLTLEPSASREIELEATRRLPDQDRPLARAAWPTRR